MLTPKSSWALWPERWSPLGGGGLVGGGRRGGGGAGGEGGGGNAGGLGGSETCAGEGVWAARWQRWRECGGRGRGRLGRGQAVPLEMGAARPVGATPPSTVLPVVPRVPQHGHRARRELQSASICSNTCQTLPWAHHFRENGNCDDGGPGSETGSPGPCPLYLSVVATVLLVALLLGLLGSGEEDGASTDRAHGRSDLT